MSETDDEPRKPRRRLRRWKVWLIIGLAHMLGFASSFHAIMSTRTSQGAIAWAVSLNAFPYVTVPAYWVLGRNKFQGYVTARRARDSESLERLGEIAAKAAPYFVADADKSNAARAAERLAELPILRGNDVELLIDGEQTFSSILEGIDAAQSYILFQFYIVHDDEIGRKVKSHLIRKAEQGVRVYFLYDEVGSYDLPESYKDELRNAGAEVKNFHTRQGPGNRFQINFRNHRKVVVVDGHTAWVGGHNVGDEYLGRNPKFGHWRDTHVRIDGPTALTAQLSFAEDWYWASSDILELDWTPRPSEKADMPVLIVPSGPADELETTALMFVHAINSAEERIWIASPYFVPDESVVHALQLAGLRGVDVRILIPEEPDHMLVYLAAFSYFDDASRTGVKFFRYGDGFLHEKAMLIDHDVAAIGTANFDNRSFRLNFEITALIADPDFALEVERMFEADFAKSRMIGPGEYSDRPLWFRLAVRMARLTSPLL
jgi:cardiolipin synthase